MTVRLAIFGTGAMAQTMIAAARALPGLELAGIASRTPDRGRQVAAMLGLRYFGDIAELAADPTVDAVYIASEPASHALLAKTALEAGKAVLCEKPCGITPEQVAYLVSVAEESGALFMEAIATPFLPTVHAAITQAQVNAMGPLRHFAAEFGYPITAQSNPVCFAAQGGGVLLDRMIYLVTIARLAAGPVSEVQARITRDRNGIDTHAALLLSHGGGAKSQLTASFSALLGNAAALGFAEGAIVIEEPLLAAEQLRVTPMSPATSRVEGSGSGLKAKLKAQPLFRKAVAFRKRQQATHLSYGSSSYAPELQHFIDLVKRGEKASPILPPSLTLEVHHVLATARAKDAVA